MKTILLGFMFLVLMSSGIALAKEPITDQGSPNIVVLGFSYDHRQVHPNVPFENRGSGDYFVLSATVKKGGQLSSYDAITGVKATHILGYEFNLRLLSNCIFWPGLGEVRNYYESVRPEDWMYTGTWTIEMKYNDAKGWSHLQYRQVSGPRPPLPILQNVAIDRLQDGTFLVSWSAQGTPGFPQQPSLGQVAFYYEVLIYDLRPENFNCPDHSIVGSFDPSTWRVYFPISSDHAGKPIRLTTRAYVYGPSGWVFNASRLTTMLP